MTAAAMEGDRERCMAAGMDDFITKPVRLEAIGAVLERWVARSLEAEPACTQAGAMGPTRVAGDAGHAADADDPLDRAQIELLLSLDDGLGEAMHQIVTEYIRVTTEGRGELLRGIDERDSGALERTAHTLKGASANVGASSMADLCAGLESRARHAQLDDAAELMERFETEFERAQSALQVVAEGS